MSKDRNVEIAIRKESIHGRAHTYAHIHTLQEEHARSHVVYQPFGPTVRFHAKDNVFSSLVVSDGKLREFLTMPGILVLSSCTAPT